MHRKANPTHCKKLPTRIPHTKVQPVFQPLNKGAIVNQEVSAIYSKTESALEYWYSEISLKAIGTQINYKRYFQSFLEFIGMTADEVLTLRKQDSKTDDMQTKHRFENLFMQFLAKGKKEGYTNGTLQSIYASIRSFFECNYYPLQMRKKDYPKSTADGVKRATKEAVLEIIAENNISLTAKVLTANDSGLGISDLRKLNCSIILDNPNSDFIHIHTKRQKTGDIVNTFLGYDAVTAIKNYLELRKKGTNKVKPEEITKDSPLFVTKKGTRASRENISNIIKNAFQRHGYKRMSAHSLRKKLQTDLEKGGMPTNWIDQVLGHQLINSRDAYSLPTTEELQEAYIKAYDHIRITPNETKITTKQTNEPDIIEVRTIEEAKKAILKGYTQAGEFDGIKLYTKQPTIHT